MNLTNFLIFLFYHSKFFAGYSCLHVAKADAIYQNYTCQIFPNPQFIKILCYTVLTTFISSGHIRMYVCVAKAK